MNRNLSRLGRPLLTVILMAIFARDSHVSAQAITPSTYCPWPGDRVETIAANAGVSAQSILDFNKIGNLQAGALLRLPPGSIPPDQWTAPMPTRDVTPLMDGMSGIYMGTDNRHKRVALTFDIGYNPRNIEFMQTMHERGIQATFFVLGLSVQDHPEIVTDILQNGQVLGALSWEHDNLAQMTSDQVQNDFTRTEQAIEQAYPGATSLPYFRAPFGSINATVRQAAADHGYFLIGWTTDDLDWRPDVSADDIYNAVVNHLCPGAIVIMHGYQAANAEALNRILDFLASNNYQIVSLSALLRPTLPASE